MLRLKKKDKSPAKDRDRLRKRREGKRRQTAVLAVLRTEFAFKFVAAVRACDLAKRLVRKSNLSSDLRSNLTSQALKQPCQSCPILAQILRFAANRFAFRA